ncbi:hypothetical protein [Atopobacter phocae]|uniref:hypothetical protein n=1 Tax=Atopobacter phocae TaxID=136492 RepID=UPI00046E63DB|nr:hypothetical protein [Atopobacter phocae]
MYPDLAHVGIAFTEIVYGDNSVQFELNLEEFTWSQYIDDINVDGGSFEEDHLGQETALKNMITQMNLSTFDDFVFVSDKLIMETLGLELDEKGNFYDPLASDLDNGGISDRYDHDFKDSDYFESTYDVGDNLDKKENKPSILGQIKAYQNTSNENKDKVAKENTQER